jgi:hypothetical protein
MDATTKRDVGDGVLGLRSGVSQELKDWFAKLDLSRIKMVQEFGGHMGLGRPVDMEANKRLMPELPWDKLVPIPGSTEHECISCQQRIEVGPKVLAAMEKAGGAVYVCPLCSLILHTLMDGELKPKVADEVLEEGEDGRT